MREFDKWLLTMKKNIASWSFYTDFERVYENVDKIKIELNILNSLIGSKNIENDFRNLVGKYSNVLNAIPILLAKREKEVSILDNNNEYIFNFQKQNLTLDDYVNFMRKTGLFDLLENHIISNLVDYVTGVEVGMDTNGRKQRTGNMMEDLVEEELKKLGLVKNKSYFKELTSSKVEKMFNIDLSKISNNGKTEKRFDFVFVHNEKVYAIECNFYSSPGSKLNETARSYKTLALESKEIDNFVFIWITDGIGWYTAKHNLEETFEILDTLYNINDLENGALKSLIK